MEEELPKKLNNIGVNNSHHAIYRGHRIGKKFEVQKKDENRNVTEVTTKQQVIVKFTSW